MPDLRHNLKAHRWWDSKLPPLFGLAYYLLSQAAVSVPLLKTLGALGLFTVGSIGIAGFGHLFNDVFDQELDEASGAENLARTGRGPRGVLLGALLVLAWLPWLFLPVPPLGYGLLVLEFLLFTFYSVPPIRLKGRGAGGALADALYAHVIPVLVTWLVFSQLAQIPVSLWFGALLLVWSLALGLRHILQHQLSDLMPDRQQHIHTLAVQWGWDRTLALINQVLLPLETVAFLLLLMVFSLGAPWVAVGFGVYVIWELIKMRHLWLQPIENPLKLAGSRRVNVLGVLVLSRFYEAWLPLLIGAALVVQSPIYAILAGLHLFLFRNGLAALLDELPALQARRRAQAARSL